MNLRFIISIPLPPTLPSSYIPSQLNIKILWVPSKSKPHSFPPSQSHLRCVSHSALIQLPLLVITFFQNTQPLCTALAILYFSMGVFFDGWQFDIHLYCSVLAQSNLFGQFLSWFFRIIFDVKGFPIERKLAEARINTFSIFFVFLIFLAKGTRFYTLHIPSRIVMAGTAMHIILIFLMINKFIVNSRFISLHSIVFIRFGFDVLMNLSSSLLDLLWCEETYISAGGVPEMSALWMLQNTIVGEFSEWGVTGSRVFVVHVLVLIYIELYLAYLCN